MARKRKAKTARQRLEDRVKYYCNRYIRLRDTIARGWGYCCTCNTPVIGGDAGHFIGKGFGGRSGVRYDERNIHLQCVDCNQYHEGEKLKYKEFMLERYGQETIDELKRLHHIRNYTDKDLVGLKLYYKQAYKELENANKNTLCRRQSLGSNGGLY